MNNETLKIEKEIDLIDWASQNSHECLTTLYNKTQELMAIKLRYYEKNIWWLRLYSQILNGLIILLIAIGILMPLIVGLVNSKNQLLFSQVGFIAIALAGLLFLVDKVFIISKSRIRFIAMNLYIIKKMTELRYIWQEYNLNKSYSETDKYDIINKHLIKIKKYMLDILDKIDEETNLWRGDFEEGMKTLIDKYTDILKSKNKK